VELKTSIQKLNKIYNKPLKEFIIPYSDTNLEKIAKIATFHSGFFQNVIFYSHNYFEIRVLVDTFKETSAAALEIIGADRIERLFVQCTALDKISQAMGLDFIDFATFRVLPDYTVQFPITLPLTSTEKKAPPLKNILKIFQKNRHLQGLNEKNLQDTFDRLAAKHTFEKNRAYIYRYDDFASNILNSHPISELKIDANIKIKIKNPDSIQKEFIKINLYNNHILTNEDIFFVFIDNAPDTPGNLSDAIARIIPGKPASLPDKEDFISIIEQLNLFLKRSSFKSIVLMIDQVKSRADAEFINYLLDASGISNIVLICFDTPFDHDADVINFDLVLNEKPGNLLEKYLRFKKPGKENAPGKEETRLLKFLSVLPVPVSREKLPDFFSSDDSTILDHLIKKNLLKIISGKIVINANLSALNIKITAEEEKNILASLLEKSEGDDVDRLSVKLSYFIKTRQTKRLKGVLTKLLRAGKGFAADLTGIKNILMENPGLLETDNQLVELFAELLVEGNDPDSAKALIVNYTKTGDNGTMPLKLKLKLAHIYKLEKNQQKLGQLLTEIKEETDGAIPKDLQDEYHYLAYIYSEKISDIKEADRNLKNINGNFYRNRAAIQLSDRHIYKGEYKKVEDLLVKAISYFCQGKYIKDEIEAKSQLAKLYREKQAFEKAEKLYKNIFIKSEMKNYRLLSAYISVDMGNLYWKQDTFKQAETWYRRALKIFQNQQDENGVMLAKSNLMDININGNWQEIRKYLKSILAYDKEKNATAPMAVDYFNISRLEYMQHHYSKAHESLEVALFLFRKENNRAHITASEILKLKLALLNPNGKIALDFFKNNPRQLNHDQKIIISIGEAVKNDPLLGKSNVVAEKAAQMESKTVQFEIISVVFHRYKTRELLELLKSLSMALSKETKNYHYYEYYYIYYSHFLQESGISEDEKERFNEMYYFFLRNQRKINPTIGKYKQLLDEKDARYDVFKSAELVGDYIQWKIPDDFFNSLVNQLRKVLPHPLNLVRLVIYESGKKTKGPLFDFSTSLTAADTFNLLTQEIITGAISGLEHLNLRTEDIKQRYKGSEKAFYPYKNTKVIFWEIAENLPGILLLAFPGEECYHYDFYERHRPLLDKFASLIHRYYENDYKLSQSLGFIIGESLPVKRLKEKILRVGKVDFPVLIRGESGSGKELVAQAVHRVSRRAGKPFVTLNAAAIPENLLEAELFGYKKGAFTGANESKTGLIEFADNGTLLLDEIADLPLNLQAKLLRVLQENEIRRLGENKTIAVNVRLIFATNKDLKKLIASHTFREDLYFRIQDLPINVPPLRERTEDIPLLVQHFLEKHNFTIPDKEELHRIIECFKNQTWTGNVRELESSVKRLITYYPDFEFDTYTDGEDNRGYDPDTGLIAARDNLEKTMVLKALQESNWNKVDAAAALKVTRQYLFRLIKKHHLNNG